MELRKTYRFEASHILPKHPGKCSRLHGHSWVLHVFVRGSVNPETGFVMDYGDISKVVKPIVEALDHRHLGAWDFEWNGVVWHIQLPTTWSNNDKAHNVEGLPPNFYPSSENLLWWIADQLWPLDLWEYKHGDSVEFRHFEPGAKIEYKQGDGPWLRRIVEWSRVALEETCTSYAELRREEYDSIKGGK